MNMPTHPTSMDVITAILTRRSIRRYAPGHVTDEQLTTILRAGFHAPTAGNKHPVHLIVVKDRELLEAFSTAKGEAKMIAQADLAIVVCGDRERQPYHDFLIEDCAAAVENMLLCAHGLDLGAVWCGVPEIMPECTQVYKDKLGLPATIDPVATIAIGVPKATRAPVDRYDESRVHYDRW